jgi:RimJ/RimL family protein N-acetyltransferase
MAIPLPDPPLADGTITLRAWRVGDEHSLAAGWADEDVQAWTGVPEMRTSAHALLWIEGEATRRSADLAIDLVIADVADGRVLGEVGLARIDRTRGVAEVGYWVLPGERGQGIAAAAVCLLVPWAQRELDLRKVFARVEPQNRASVAVARSAGFERRGRAEGFEIWSAPAARAGGTVPP